MTETQSTESGKPGFFKTLGELRTALVSGAVISLLTIPFADPSIRYDSIGVLADVIIPVLTILIIFVLLLDSLMSRIFMSQHEGEGRRRFRFILRTNLILVALLILGWTPYFIKALT